MNAVFNTLLEKRKSFNRKTTEHELSPITRKILDVFIISGEDQEIYETINKNYDFLIKECEFYDGMSTKKILDAKEEALCLVALYANDEKYSKCLEIYNKLKANL